MYGNNFCDFCKTDEDYSHYFITCAFFNEFWGKQSNLMKDMGIETTIFFKHIVLGYNIYDKNLSNIRFFVKQNVVGFSIYKSYYISEQKTKHSNVYRLLVNEYIKRIKEKKTLQNCAFLMKVKNHILIAN